MVIAYVLVKAHTGEVEAVQRAIADLDGVVDVAIVAGDVDLIAKLDVDSPAAVRDLSAARIQAIDGVENTHTYVAMDG